MTDTTVAYPGEEGAYAAEAGAQLYPDAELMAVRLFAEVMRAVTRGEAGYGVLMLGADVPAHALVASAVRHEPDVICISATMPDPANRAVLAVHELQAALPRAGYVLGGRAVFPRLRSRPGIEVCRRIGDAVDAVDALVKRADLN